MIVGIASGKGGTGKTTVSVNLASVLGPPVQVLDCDVEAPNIHLFLPGRLKESSAISLPVPEVDHTLCDCCAKCSQFCEFGAIAALRTEVLVFPELCHGCGGCLRVCPKGAIQEIDHRIGVVETLESGEIELVQGRLDVGVPMAPPLIRAVKDKLQYENTVILDAPPGTSCPVVTTLRGVDFTLLVTEPTPFGLNDLQLAVQMVRELKLPFGVFLNRTGIGDNRIHEFCTAEGITILGELPEDRRIAQAYSRGALIVNDLPEYREVFESLSQNITKQTIDAVEKIC